jgi:hypothetical protein
MNRYQDDEDEEEEKFIKFGDFLSIENKKFFHEGKYKKFLKKRNI